jgi:serine/threonine protein phosphatase PrpC
MMAVGLSDRGKVREINEDAFRILQSLEARVLAVVADGMGGHLAGEVASRMAVDSVCNSVGARLRKDAESPADDEKELLYEVIELANEEIYQFSMQNAQLSGMGTTIVAALADADRLLVAHVGDSRLYLCSEGQLIQLTEDHSHVQNLVNQGIITAEEAKFHPKRNIILRALGTDPFVDIDLLEYQWRQGDIVLMCSDGLSNLVSDEELLHALQLAWEPHEILQWLIDKANGYGGEDNITAVFMRNEFPQAAE